MPLLACQPLLLWPAFWNGYPLLFADSGTYISQVVERHLGWDRPPFYALGTMVLSLRLSLWPVILVQGLATAWILVLACRVCWPGWRSGRALIAVTAVLALLTPLPWVTAEIMPDFLTALMALAIWLMLEARETLRRWEVRGLCLLVAAAIACHQANGLIACPLILGVTARGWLAGGGWRWRSAGALSLAVLAGFAALATANLLGHRRLAISPYGDVFLLARLIADGPARLALALDCPTAGWRLCPYRNRLPMAADDFLWRADSPLYALGGPVALSAEASAIDHAALHLAPIQALRAALANAGRQAVDVAMAPPDEVQPWPATAGRAVLRDLPLDAPAYRAARQTRDRLALPPWWRRLSQEVCAAAVLGCLWLAWRRWREPLGGLAAVVLLLWIVNAVVLGALSGPHARYQARIAWLPVATLLLGCAPRSACQPVERG